MYRIRRAVQLSLSHKILPKEEWTKMEDVSFRTPFPYPICPLLPTPGCLAEHIRMATDGSGTGQALHLAHYRADQGRAEGEGGP